MDLQDLEYFVAIAETLSLRRAAARLGVRQPTLSRRIRDLEDGLGVSLLERHSGGVRLTAAGQDFLEAARRILSEIETVRREARRAGLAHTGRLAIGFFTSIVSGPLHDLLCRFRRGFPEVEVRLREGSQADLLSDLSERATDVAFLAGTLALPHLDTLTVWYERVHAVLPADHRLARNNAARWSDLAGETLIRGTGHGVLDHGWLMQRLYRNGTGPVLVHHAAACENLIGLAAAGYGITITSQSASAACYPGVVFRPIAEDDALLPITMAWQPGNPNPALRRFLSLARTVARTAA